MARRVHPNGHDPPSLVEGATTTPFDMCVRNQIDGFTLVLGVIRRVPGIEARVESVTRFAREKLAAHGRYVVERGIDLPEVRDWHWGGRGEVRVQPAARDTAADNG